MIHDTENFISLSALAKESGFNKSRLAYYADKGLLERVATIGRMGIYDREKSKAVLKDIVRLKKGGFSLSAIKNHVKAAAKL